MKTNRDKEEIKDLDKVEPIDYGVVAKPHTPIYKMHRYFARRPYTVFNELIKHYSNPGSIVLDPMCGGGVTIVEGLKLRRKVIGVDLNPMAIFITRYEVIDVDLNKLKRAFNEISEKVKDEINNLYLTKCPKCEKETPAVWFEWSKVVECPRCGEEVIFAEAKKLKAGTYQCSHCKIPIKSLTAKRKPDKIVRLKLKCACGFKGEKKPDKYDLEKYKWIEDNFGRIVKEQDLWYPKDKIFLGEKTRELLTKGYKYFYELFTTRNLLTLSILLKGITENREEESRELLYLAFTSGLFETSRLSHIKGGTVVKPGHHYWLADISSEVNVWRYFENRYKAIYRGKRDSSIKIGSFYKKAQNLQDIIDGNTTCLLLVQSATDLKELPDESIDVVITDPPYGANVNYTELSDFWTIWLRNNIGIENGLIDNTKEAIENKYQKKGADEYRQLMYEIFKE
ncbi:MAG: DNA methyltransferase, partial [bacterium]|nr:DNA methyltransferase [bacterium]